jgi:hypothetical protein
LESYDIKNYIDVRYYCSKLGLFPIEIKNKDYIGRISNLLKFLGWDLSLPNIIPLGYDYGCEKSSCTNTFQSLNNKDAKNIFPFFGEADKDLTVLNSLKKKEAIGLGFSSDAKPYLFQMADFNYTALVCSTNDYGKVNDDPSIIKLSCKDNLLNKRMDADIGKTLKMSCPENCHFDESIVYGESRYSFNSSICKAAIHSGAINAMFGGEFTVNIAPSQNTFIGSLKFDIKSESIQMESPKSFVPSKLNEKCPIDFLKPFLKGKGIQRSSFIETEMNTLMKTNSKFLDQQQLIDFITNKPKIFKNTDVYRLLQVEAKQANITINTGNNTPASNNTNNSTNSTTSIVTNANQTANNSNTTSDNSTGNNNNSKIIELDEELSLPCNDINTDNAIIRIEEIRKIDYSDLKNIQRQALDLEKMTSKFSDELSWAKEGSALSSPLLLKRINEIRSFSNGMKVIEQKISKIADSRLKFTQSNLKELKSKLLKLGRTINYKLNFKTIQDYWTTFNNKNSENFPADVSIYLILVVNN